MLLFKGETISFGEVIMGTKFEQLSNGDIYIEDEGIKKDTLEVSLDGINFLKVNSNYETFMFEEFKVEGFKSKPDRDVLIKQPKYKGKVYTILIEK